MTDSSKAEEHLRVIRSLMEKATLYRAISAPTALVGGLASTIFGSWFYFRAGGLPLLEARGWFLAGWLGILALTLAANTGIIWREAGRRGEPFISAGMRQALRALLPPMLCGAVLTLIFGTASAARYWLMLPQCWMICYGLGLLATLHFAPRSIPILGWFFLLTGLGTLVSVRWMLLGLDLLPVANLQMLATFGLFHLVYAGCTWPRRARRRQTFSGTPAPMFDLDKLDKTIHEKGRLGIMTLLATRPVWSFQDLKAELKMSDGNLVTHLRTLHDAGLVSVTKEILDRPQTTYGLTVRGREAFREYLKVLEQIVQHTNGAVSIATGRLPSNAPGNFATQSLAL